MNREELDRLYGEADGYVAQLSSVREWERELCNRLADAAIAAHQAAEELGERRCLICNEWVSLDGDDCDEGKSLNL